MHKKLILHLPKDVKKSVDQGAHPFFALLLKTFDQLGFDTATARQGKHSGRVARMDKNYHIFNIDGAIGPRALNIRKAHFYPFWSLENAGRRRTPRITKLKFEPEAINGIEAQEFFNKICVRNLPAHPAKLPDNDFVYVPLQGRILKRRKWQYFSTKEMIDLILKHEPERNIIVKPHPREHYSSAEQKFINGLEKTPRISVSNADTYGLLNQCAYVATQNSAVAFEGFLYQKRAILFAKSDFPHICETVTDTASAAPAFENLRTNRPPFEKYIYWYLQKNCINAGRADAGDRILEMLEDCGWGDVIETGPAKKSR